MSHNPFTTTRLLTAATTRLSATLPHRRNRVALLIAAGCFLPLLVAGLLTNHRQAHPLPPTAAPVIILVWTPSPQPTPRPLPTATAQPTWTPAPTREPHIITQRVEIPVYVPVPMEQGTEPTGTTHEIPSDDPGPHAPPPMLYGERLDEYFERTGVTPVAVP